MGPTRDDEPLPPWSGEPDEGWDAWFEEWGLADYGAPEPGREGWGPHAQVASQPPSQANGQPPSRP